jgi:hypothetical protein
LPLCCAGRVVQTLRLAGVLAVKHAVDGNSKGRTAVHAHWACNVRAIDAALM